MKALLTRVRDRIATMVPKRRPDPAIRRFIQHNRRKWPQSAKGQGESVVLVGMFQPFASIFCYSYVTNYLALKHHARIEAYHFVGRINPTYKEIYESFGARFTLTIADADIHEERIARETEKILAGLKTRHDVLEITVDGVLIGDQIYDSYLRFYTEPTVDIADPRFKALITQSLRIFYATTDYLKSTKVAAFITDDFCYINSGIITRLLHRAGVPIYVVYFGEKFFVQQVDPLPTGAYHEFPPPVTLPYYAYPRLFAELDETQRSAALQKGRKVMEERLSGKFCQLVDMPATTYAAATERVLDEGPEPRVLVMLHDFIDSPHGYRGMLFSDFYDWIVFLLERAEKTSFRWYVKPHPAGLDLSRNSLNVANAKVVEELRQRFPKVTFLSEGSSNQQILKDGVSAMFTVHGTAAHEFAYRGIPVVNCGDNPHIAYDFNIHAASLEEYERCILEADQLKVQIDPRRIEEFVYMHYFHLQDLLASPVNPIEEEVFADPDWPVQIARPAILERFMAGATPERERGLEQYFDRLFSQPHYLHTTQKT